MLRQTSLLVKKYRVIPERAHLKCICVLRMFVVEEIVYNCSYSSWYSLAHREETYESFLDCLPNFGLFYSFVLAC